MLGYFWASFDDAVGREFLRRPGNPEFNRSGTPYNTAWLVSKLALAAWSVLVCVKCRHLRELSRKRELSSHVYGVSGRQCYFPSVGQIIAIIIVYYYAKWPVSYTHLTLPTILRV